MASGSWNFGTSNPNIEGRVEWWANQQGAVNNYSDIRVRVLFHRTNSGYQSWGTLNTRVRLDTANADTRAKDFSTNVTLTEPSNWVTVCDNSSYRVYHNSDGKKSCYIRIYGDADFGCSFDSSKTVNFDTIPRYTSITNWLAASTTNSSITFKWDTADAISNIVCLFNGTQKYSASVNANSGSFTINGLTESTTYSNITIKVTRKDSGLITTSSALSAATTWSSHTSNLSLSSRSINSITLNWSSNYACDAIWIYNGSSQIYSASGLNTTNGTVTLSPTNWSSIQPETTYSLKINVRRKASQWGQMSGAISVTTLALPVVNSSTPTSFNIGNNALTVNVSNAANADYSLVFQIGQSSWTTYKTINVAKGITSTSIPYTKSELYARCPSENTLPTRVTCQVTVNSKTYTSSYYNITAKVTDSNPSFTDFSWETNIGTNINDVISGSQNMIAGYGGLRLKFAADCAAPLNYAAISALEAKILFNGSVITYGTIDYNSSAFTFDVSTANITTAGTYTIQINALDSRKNKSAVKSHSFIVYPYQRPSVSANLYRFNNFEQATFIELTGKIAKITISDVQKNAVTSIKYRAKESGTSYPDAYTSITGYSTNSVNGTDNLLLSFNKTNESDPFATLSYEKSYVFQFLLTDKLFTSASFEVTVEQGIPLMSVSEDGYVGVGLVPDFNSKAKLQVNTDIVAKGRNILDEIDKKLNTSNIVNNLSTTSAGYAIDARQGIVVNDSLNLLTKTVNGKSPISHASSETIYGVGTTGNYGHIKLANNLTTASYQNGLALSANQGKALKDLISSFPTFAAGRTSLITVSGGSYQDVSIVFGKTFNSVPNIYLTFYGYSQNVKFLGLACTEDISTSRGTIRISNAGSSSYSIYVNWLAIS